MVMLVYKKQGRDCSEISTVQELATKWFQDLTKLCPGGLPLWSKVESCVGAPSSGDGEDPSVTASTFIEHVCTKEHVLEQGYKPGQCVKMLVGSSKKPIELKIDDVTDDHVELTAFDEAESKHSVELAIFMNKRPEQVDDKQLVVSSRTNHVAP